MNEVKVNRIYRHYKGKYYIVVDIAIDSDSLEEIVLYRALYGEGKLWARNKKDFLAEISHKNNSTNQKYRFELQ